MHKQLLCPTTQAQNIGKINNQIKPNSCKNVKKNKRKYVSTKLINAVHMLSRLQYLCTRTCLFNEYAFGSVNL